MKRLLIFCLAILMAATGVYARGQDEVRASRIIDQFVDGDFAAVYKEFDATMKQALPLPQLGMIWYSLIEQAGGFNRQVLSTSELQQGYNVVVVTCEFEKGIINIVLSFDSLGQIAGLFFTPGYLPSNFDEAAGPGTVEEYELGFSTKNWDLPGTLTLPKGPGPHQVVILVHGSGPQDRDEKIGPNKPFQDLAWGLAERGVAVYRYDKRTLVYGAAAFEDEVTVWDETINDVLSAIELLKEIPEIDSQQIFVLGHSLGGMVIPRIAKLTQDVKGYISLAGSCRPLEDLIWDQTNYLLSLAGSPTAEDQQELAILEAQIQLVKSAELKESTPSELLPLGVPAPYWLDLRDYNPAEEAKEIPVPLLILQGERDYQVTEEDFNIWRSALAQRDDVEFILYPHLNHLFMAGEGLPNPWEYENPGNLDQAVIQDISVWVGTH